MAVGLYLLCLISVTYALGAVISCPHEKQYDVIVVGCGVSGLSAAGELGRSGKRVLCLEAADRIGGRVKTVPFGDKIVEEGAEWIHGTEGSLTYALAIANNVPLKEQEEYQYFYRSSDGKVNSTIQDILNIGFECAFDVEVEGDTPLPLGDAILESCNAYLAENYPDFYNDKKLLSEFFFSLNLAISEYDGANDWNELSTTSTYEELGGYLYNSWHELGYKTLFELILNTYNGGDGLPTVDILLNTEVTNIAWSDESVTVTTRNNTSYTAPQVIVTLSLGVLKERHTDLFTPALPRNKNHAINEIPFGIIYKIIMSFEENWWNSDEKKMDAFIWKEEDIQALSAEDKWIQYISSASRPMGSDNTFTFWASGDSEFEIETMPEELLRRGVVKILRTFYGEDTPEPKDILRTTWLSNPLILGAYSYDGLDMDSDARTVLAAPVTDNNGAKRILFAGEATNLLHFATVHGAYETGVREAQNVV